MENLLLEIKALPNIIGSFVYVEPDGVKYSNLPRIFIKENLGHVGRSVNKLFAMNKTTDLAVSSLQIRFDESIAHARQIDDTATVITFCDPNANISLLNMTSNLLVKEFQNAIEKHGEANDGILPDNVLSEMDLAQIDKALDPLGISLTKTQQPDTSPPDLEYLLSESPISKALNGMQDALVKAIGPIGGLIFGDTLEKWGLNNDYGKERLEELADMLCREIDDAGLEKEFRADIVKFLK